MDALAAEPPADIELDARTSSMPPPSVLKWRRTPEDAVKTQQSRRQAITALAQARAELPDAHRDIVEHHYIEGRTLRRVAEDTGIAYLTVVRRHGRALVWLRERLVGMGITEAAPPSSGRK
jgi:RNA polymerase sigma factor (sigma-70 family)